MKIFVRVFPVVAYLAIAAYIAFFVVSTYVSRFGQAFSPLSE